MRTTLLPHLSSRAGKATLIALALSAALLTGLLFARPGEAAPASNVLSTVSIKAGPDVWEGKTGTFTITADPVPAGLISIEVEVHYPKSSEIQIETHLTSISSGGTTTISVKVPDDDYYDHKAKVTAVLTYAGGHVISDTKRSASFKVIDDLDRPPQTAFKVQDISTTSMYFEWDKPTTFDPDGWMVVYNGRATPVTQHNWSVIHGLTPGTHYDIYLYPLFCSTANSACHEEAGSGKPTRRRPRSASSTTLQCWKPC